MQNNPNIPVPHEFMVSMYERRMIILMENEDSEGSGFSQVILTPKGFKEVSEAVMGSFPNLDQGNGIQSVEMELGERVFPSEIFKGVESCTELSTEQD